MKTTFPELEKPVLAFIDSFGGLIPCRITHLRREETSTVEIIANVQITANRPGYRKGETIGQSLSRLVPRHAVYRSRQRCGQFMIKPYSWAEIIPSLRESA